MTYYRANSARGGVGAAELVIMPSSAPRDFLDVPAAPEDAS